MKNKAALGVLFFTTFLDLLGFGIIIPILPGFTRSLGASVALVGIIASIYSTMNFAFSPFWGRMSDRFGRRPVILASIIITAMAYLVFANTASLLLLVVSRVFSGIGSANIGAAQAYIGDVTTPQERAKTMGFMGAAFGLGFIFGPPLGGVVAERFGTEGLGYMAAGLSALNFVVAYFFLPESLKVKNLLTRRRSVISRIVEQLKKPDISKLFYVYLIFQTAFSMMQITAALLWEDKSFLDESQIGLMFMYIGVCTVLVQVLLVGRLVKVFGETRMVVIGLVLMMIGLFGMPFFQDKLLVPYEFLALALIALANGFLSPALMSLITRVSNPEELGQLTGTFQSFGSLGRIIGPVVGGALYGWSFYLPYTVGPVLLIGALIVAIRIRKSPTFTNMMEENTGPVKAD